MRNGVKRVHVSALQKWLCRYTSLEVIRTIGPAQTFKAVRGRPRYLGYIRVPKPSWS